MFDIKTFAEAKTKPLKTYHFQRILWPNHNYNKGTVNNYRTKKERFQPMLRDNVRETVYCALFLLTSFHCHAQQMHFLFCVLCFMFYVNYHRAHLVTIDAQGIFQPNDFSVSNFSEGKFASWKILETALDWNSFFDRNG